MAPVLPMTVEPADSRLESCEPMCPGRPRCSWQVRAGIPIRGHRFPFAVVPLHDWLHELGEPRPGSRRSIDIVEQSIAFHRGTMDPGRERCLIFGMRGRCDDCLKLPLVCVPHTLSDSGTERRTHVFAINGSVELLNVLRELLPEEAYNVTTTNFVPHSFALIAAWQPDALIVDVVIGQHAGWELLERLHAAAVTAGIPVLVLSTNPWLLERAQEQATKYGSQPYLGKPFDLEAMLAQIRQMIGEA